MISKFVYKTNNVLYHSVLQKELPHDASEKQLRDNLFLDDQNLDAIKSRLCESPDFLNLVIIPTWECNLRCNHCCVLDSLKKKDVNEINVDKLNIFLDNYFKKFKSVKKIQTYFLGGESFLYPEKIFSYIQVCEKITNKYNLNLNIGTTTNLAFPLKVEHIKCFEKLDVLAVSLDGFSDYHNKQRHPFNDKKINPFETTILNLKKIIACGFREKIHVQAALNDEKLNDDNYLKEFYKMLSKIGINIENIMVGSIFPTKQKPKPQKSWIEFKKESFFIKSKPCCKYKFMSNIQINPDNSLQDNFYSNENSYLGTLDDDIEEISKKNYDLIFNHMPALQDKNCLGCTALGYCWGGCIAGHIHIGNKPSLTCNKNKIVPFIKKLAEENQLIDYKPQEYLKNLL